MITTEELRRALGPLGIWMPPPARSGADPESYSREIEAAGFTSVWYPGMNSAAALIPEIAVTLAPGAPGAAGDLKALAELTAGSGRPRYNWIMVTTNELRRTLGPVGIWMHLPAFSGLDPETFAQQIEAAGFTSVWYALVNSPADLAVVERSLAATERLVVGTGIASVWTWEPAELASAVSRLERLYPGRFVLGLGVSHAVMVESAGQSYAKPYTKMAGFLDELPDAGAPVVLAALGPRMLKLSAERTAGAHPYFTPPAHTRFAREVLGPAPLLIPEIALSLASGAPGADRARSYARGYLTLPNYTNNLRRFGYADADFAGGGSDQFLSDLVPHGPQAAVARIGDHLAAGADHVVVQLLDEGFGKFAADELKPLADLTAGLR